MPAAVSSVASEVSATGVSAMTSVSAGEALGRAGQRRADGGAAVVPAEHDGVRAHRRRRPRRIGARSGTSAALWNRPPPTTAAEVTIVTSWPGLGQVQRRPEAAPVAEVVEHEHARARRPRVPSSTSWIDTTSARSAPGRRSTIGSARWNPVRGGRAPVATTTSSAPRGARRRAAVAAVPSRTSTPSASSRRPYHASRSPIWSRDGCRPASRNCPPSSSPRSRSVTRWPRSAATRAASSPAGPPPTTSTDFARRRPARTDRRPTRTRDRPTGSRGTRSSSRATGGPSTAGCTRCTAGRRRRGRRGPWRPGAGRRSGRGRC